MQALDQKVLQPLLLGPARSNQLRKPLLVIAVTDGAPGGESRDTLSRVIKNTRDQLRNSRYGEDALSVQLAMVGNDMGARKFLEGELFRSQDFKREEELIFLLVSFRSTSRNRQRSFHWRFSRLYFEF